MKTIWPYFLSGACIALVIFFSFNESFANDKDAIVKTAAAPKEQQFAQSLIEKDQMLQEKERQLKDMEERLKAQEAIVKDRVDQLSELQAQYQKMSQEAAATKKHIEASLVKTYETMAPKKAAEVIAVMQDDLAVELLMLMKSKKVAAIVDKMDSNRAMILSSKIAERRPNSTLSSGLEKAETPNEK